MLLFSSKQLTFVKESNYPAKFKSLSLRQQKYPAIRLGIFVGMVFDAWDLKGRKENIPVHFKAVVKSIDLRLQSKVLYAKINVKFNPKKKECE